MKDTSRVDDSGAYTDSTPLDAFRDLLRSHVRVETLLQSVVEQVVAVVPGADMAGVTLPGERPGETATAACTDGRVFAVDSDQFRSGEGPSLDAARTRSKVRARLSDIAVRWPTFAADAADVGVRSYLSVPISVDTDRIGSLNIYSWTDHGFSDTDEILLSVFAAAVESAVWNSRRALAAQTELDGLREAMRTRAAIEQAKGIVMAIRGIGPDDAFDVLSIQSQSENVKLSEIARRVVLSVRRDT
ncbi:ANTAR domain-containing response regulator [Rhodococcoides kyotonense]|uniref:GAF domain-containing protein n=1 Tax=Rhodococcoides kyotonense TaxID=398843 RepID=A0A239DYU5_9NOCA|nr:GAF and ANTAR domain-containing protein [Rhodococcus kyotonensis]SNS37168.1 GAF domain-containing protein [Rhodococcus kyotonensis]